MAEAGVIHADCSVVYRAQYLRLTGTVKLQVQALPIDTKYVPCAHFNVNK